MTNAWQTLPDEIFENIIGRLVRNEWYSPRCKQVDLAAVRLVSKCWSKPVPNAVKTLDVEGEIPDCTLTRNMSSLESLTWTYGIYSPSFTPPASLKALKLRYAVPSGSLKHLVMWFPGIEILAIHRIPMTCRGGYDLSPLASLTALKSLSLIIGDELGQPGDHPIRKIIGLEKLVNLTSLEIYEHYMAGLPQAVLQLTRLESLKLRGYHTNYIADMEVVRAALAARSE